MKKIYMAPDMEVLNVKMSNILTASDQDIEEGGHEGKPQAPGMMSFDEMDDYDDEDGMNY